jgi:excisionase family DNA binding protein
MSPRANGLLTAKQVAETLGLQESTIRAWLVQRRLPRVKCGRAVRIPLKAVKRFILENTIPARSSR